MNGRCAQRVVGAAALAGLAIVVLGCMSLSIADRVVQSPGCLQEGEVLCQEGKALLATGERLKIFYPIPYGSAPNLELQAADRIELEDQKPDHFVVYNMPHAANQTRSVSVSWKARGVRRPPSAAPESVPGPGLLPERPAPVEKPNG